MTDSVAQKSIALMLLIVVGYLLREKFKEPTATGAIRYFILNVALPATIFLSVIEIDTQLNLIRLPSFALGVNLSFMAIGVLLASTLLKQTEKAKTRALILLFPSLAPGLTVYPFIEQFLGRSGLAWAALADMGNKLFVLIGLYVLAIYWFQQANVANTATKVKGQWGSIGRFLLTEPVNFAIVIGVILACLNLGGSLPLALTDAIQKLALCSTPLILFYIGASLNPKSFQFGTILLVLLAKAGVGFLLSAIAIWLLRPQSIEEITLFVALPQASFSLWPLLHASKINSQDSFAAVDRHTPFFDTQFATALLAMSFPFSILILLVVFSSGAFFRSSEHLCWAGGSLLMVFGLLCGLRSLPLRLRNPLSMQVRLRNPVIYTPKPVRIAPPDIVNLSGVQPTEAENGKSVAMLVEQEIVFVALHNVLKQHLGQEMQNPTIRLQFRYILENRQLVVIGQHQAGSVINLESIMGSLEAEVRLLKTQFVDQLRLYLKFSEQQTPYHCVSISLKSPQPASGVHPNFAN